MLKIRKSARISLITPAVKFALARSNCLFLKKSTCMKTILPGDLPTQALHAYLQSSVGPRPIALASTVDENGNPNLSPFSFFNLFSSNPPILIFSPSRRVRDNTTKHTLNNVHQVKEVVINVVNYSMVQQTSLSSTEYAQGVDEFTKAGFTALPSEVVQPLRVKESPVQFECKVNEIISLGSEGGAGNLVVCEILRMHISEDVLNESGQIDQHLIDLVARLGGNWYSRSVNSLFEVPKPLTTLGIGVDLLPDEVRLSQVLTGNDLGMLGNVETLPTKEEVVTFVGSNPDLQQIVASRDLIAKHQLAQRYLSQVEVETAWKVLLAE